MMRKLAKAKKAPSVDAPTDPEEFLAWLNEEPCTCSPYGLSKTCKRHAVPTDKAL